MFVRKSRLEKGWSQEHLAQLSGLSVRTIQRIENGQKVGLESGKCLAAVFETDVANLMQEQVMSSRPTDAADPAVNEYDSNRKAFLLNAAAFAVVMPALYLVNREFSPEELWVKWVALFWGLSFVLHGATMMIAGRSGSEE